MQPTTRPIAAAALALLLSNGAGAGQRPSEPAIGRKFGDIVALNFAPIAADEGVAQGRVVDDRTGLAIAHATVLLVPTFVPGREQQGLTDERGRYQIRGLTPGEYSVVGSAAGYLDVRTNSPSALETTTSVTILGGRITGAVDVSLTEAAIISGRIFDAAGDGFPDVQVDILTRLSANGPAAPVSTVRTDGLGEFRAEELQPGSYLVRATLPGALRRPDPDRPDAYAPTLYPATTRVAEAQELRVDAGQALFGIDFGLMTAEPVALTGIVLDPTGTVLEGARITLHSGLRATATVGATTSDANGAFRLAGIIPADYVLAVAHSTRGQLRRPLNRTDAWSDVEIRFPGTITVEGRITYDGTGPLPFETGRLGVMAFTTVDGDLFFRGQISSNMSGAQVEPDGAFTLAELAVPAQLSVRGAPRGWAVKAIRVDGVDVTYERPQIRQGTTSVEITLTDRLTELTGLVTDEAGRPVASCTVVVFPANPDLRGQLRVLVRGVRPNQHGQFRVEGLPPADYLAIAVAGLRKNAWTDPEVLNRLWSGATPFRADDGEPEALQLRVGPAPRGL